MNRFLLFIFVFLCNFLSMNVEGQVTPDNSIETDTTSSPSMLCSIDMLQYKLRKDPAYKAREEEMNRAISNAYQRLTGDTITLPVVVHIINQAPVTITDQMVINGIKDLNDAFSKAGIYAASLGADTKIRFCLSKKGPDGGISTGITRTQTTYGDNLNMQTEDERLKNLIIWNPLKYINIWLVTNIWGESYASFSCGIWKRIGVSGYATMPPGGTLTDGIVVTGFGKGLAHEMGHYLGLYHTFEGGCRNYDCLTDGDMVCDTPPDNSIRPSPSCSNPANTCNTDTLSAYSNGIYFINVDDQIANFMDYGNTPCSNAFTQGQADRMRAAVDTFRFGLLEDECDPPCNQNIIASFTTDNEHPLPGTLVTFSNTSSGAAYFTWLVNNVVVSNTVNFSYTFSTSAKFKVTLKAFNTPGCFASSTQNIFVDCGVISRFYSGIATIASMVNIYTDSITFTNSSVNASEFTWLVSNNHGMVESAVSNNVNLVYTFRTPSDYFIRLAAKTGTCKDTSELYTVTVLDPTADGMPSNLSMVCYDQNKIKAHFCLSNMGFAFLPKNTPVNFYDKNPALPGATKLSPTFYLPADVRGKCVACYNHILNAAYRNIEQLFVVFNDTGITVPVVLPNTSVREFKYNNNVTHSPSNRSIVSYTICEGQQYLGYALAGTYIDTFPSFINGCDSIRTLNLRVLHRAFNTVNATLCNGENYGGHSSTGVYIDTFQAINGCDSVRTLYLTIKPKITSSISMTICAGEQYAGYSTTGTYVDVFIASDGCDSTRTLILAIKQPVSSNISATICQGGSYLGYTTSGDYTDIFSATNGCDSTRMLHLVVKPVITKTVSATVCYGQSFEGYTSAGSYTDHFTASNGCDSTRILELSIQPAITSDITATICEGESYGGYASSGNYSDIFTSANGCDSTRHLHLTVRARIRDTIAVSVCAGQSYDSYTLPGTYIDNFTATGGCDSIRTVILSIRPAITSFVNATVCQGENYQGHTISGNYTDVFTATNGCDSTRTLQLIVNPRIIKNIAATVCYGLAYDGHMSTGTYIDHFTSSNGCDSTRILDLIVQPLLSSILEATICEGENFAGYTTTGDYSDIFTTANGCDSSRLLHLIVKPKIRQTVSVSICEGENYAGHNSTGIYVDTYTASSGCDSIRTLHLTVKQKTTSSYSIVMCSGESYGGHNTNGSYIDIFTGSNGCDSIRTLQLTVRPAITTTYTVTLCDGQNYQGHTISGNYTDTFTAFNGCDSTRLLHLEVNPKRTSTQFISLCSGESYFAQGHTQSVSGMYYDTTRTIHGCDSIIITHITVNPLPSPNLGADRLLCYNQTVVLNPGDFNSYIWQNGASSPTFTTDKAGAYYVKVSNAYGCTYSDTMNVIRVLDPVKDFLPKDTTICRGNILKIRVPGYASYLWNTGSTSEMMDISTGGLYNLSVENGYGCKGKDFIIVTVINCIGIQVPNAFTPDNNGNNDVFKPLIPAPVTDYHMQILNRAGQILFSTTDYKKGWDGTFKGAKQEMGTYIYFISLIDIDGQPVQLNGALLLLR